MIATHFHIGRVGPVIEPVALERALEAKLDPLVSSHIVAWVFETAAPPPSP
jgi:hypothetical protein